ncbi:MAG: hypothetical protein ACYC9P_02645 [Rudaea sp.]
MQSFNLLRLAKLILAQSREMCQAFVQETNSLVQRLCAHSRYLTDAAHRDFIHEQLEDLFCAFGFAQAMRSACTDRNSTAAKAASVSRRSVRSPTIALVINRKLQYGASRISAGSIRAASRCPWRLPSRYASALFNRSLIADEHTEFLTDAAPNRRIRIASLVHRTGNSVRTVRV